MLRDLLRSHPRLAIPSESHFIPGLYRACGDPRSSRGAERLGARLLRHPSVRRWHLDLYPTDFSGCRSFAAAVGVLYRRFADGQGRARWGDKTPQYVTELPTLLEIFPSARIIHIYRDGRDVALSWLEHPHGPRTIYGAAVSWTEAVSAARRADLPRESYLEVRYESLLADPAETMRGVCEFVGEEWTEATLRPADRPRSPLNGRTVGRGAPTRRTIEADNQGKWRVGMDPTQRAVFESVAGELLIRLGYGTESRRIRIRSGRKWLWEVENRYRTARRRLRFSRWAGRGPMTLGRDLKARSRNG